MRHKTRFGVDLLVVAVSLLVVLSGPRAVGRSQDPQGGQAKPVEQLPSFRAGTTLVQVDAIVRNRSGKFVADLKEGDFQILEDGVPQRIEQFYLVADPGLDAESPWVADPPIPAEVERAIRPAPERRVFVFYFDQPHLAFGNGRRAREAALTFIDQQFRSGDIGGVVVGRAMANRRLTSDRSELVAAIRAVQPSHEAINLNNDYYREWPRFRDAYEVYAVAARESAVTEIVLDRALSEANASPSDQVTRSADPTAPLGAAEVRETTLQRVIAKAQRGVDEFRRATLDTLHILQVLNSGLAKMDGRKTVVLLSDGFVIEENLSPLRELEGAAARSDVRIYAIDTRGLETDNVDGDITAKLRPETPGAARSPDVVFDGLAELARATGGFAVTRQNDLGSALSRIDRDTSSYYVLGYRPTNAKQDGTFRKIQVRVTRRDVEVRSRRGYSASRF
jgi:VWFA-related protein